jgi:hypothetical protein
MVKKGSANDTFLTMQGNIMAPHPRGCEVAFFFFSLFIAPFFSEN